MPKNPIANYNIKREIQKRAERAAKRVPLIADDAARELFLDLVAEVAGDLNEGQVVQELTDHFAQTKAKGKTPSLTNINTSVNRVFRKAINWSKRNSNASEVKKAEFTAQIKVAARSCCRMFDQQATCWKATL